MTNYENITNQTIQLFPQLFLGKHGPSRALRRLVKPSDNVGWSCSFHKINRSGVRHKVNIGEHSQSVVKRKVPDESVGFILQAAQLEGPAGKVTARRPSLGSHSAGGIVNGPKCLGKRQPVTSKVTSHRSYQAIYLAGKLTGNGMLTAVGVRDEEEAKASGNAEDRVVPGLPFHGNSHIPQGVMPADVFR